MKFLLTVLLFAFVSADADNARLLAAKNILNEILVEGRDLTVQYNIFNVGGSAAREVSLTDASFPESDFEVIQGSLEVNWNRLAPGSNVSHAVILRPTKSGYFNFTSAEISYLASEEASERQIGYTSGPGEGGIMHHRDYDRKFSPHVIDWAAFAVMTLPSLGIPFLLWFSSKSKYDKPRASKKHN
ncbi:hypothetical protein CAPTEDRAFT_184319 [Capitella teleta]|uniref:Translocon-associated protein subunit beta n=1 Tax=Capitella teleta TaxID=283909 RepID=R7UH65_CAPTE|nr:hypothetical protein CAPTEDRAFT_184319 [Capitella teleta]|eukprot:ELU02607.1 hypothetical protein CAPTEDRAFT_184319 [Capitella teleta]